MVQFINVEKQYDGGHIAAVKTATFKIDEGEFVFLIGPSGSGKTTIIKMLIRDVLPSNGKIYFNDIDITKVSRNKVYKLRREIGIIFQDYKLVPEKNAYENVAFAMEAAGKTDHEIQETVPYVLDIVGLSDRMMSFPAQLSGGEQQRVAIARAIANNPKILIADEPTGNLDPASSWDIVQILSKINNWGTTVIMSTHGTDIVNSLNKRVIQMENGEIIRDDSRGQYEMTSRFENNMLDSTKDKSEETDSESVVVRKKGPFKVKIANEKAKEELKEAVSMSKEIQKEENKKGFNLFGFFGRKKKEDVIVGQNEEGIIDLMNDEKDDPPVGNIEDIKGKSGNVEEVKEEDIASSSKKETSNSKEEVSADVDAEVATETAKKSGKKSKTKVKTLGGQNLLKTEAKKKNKTALNLDLTSNDKSSLGPVEQIDKKLESVSIDSLEVTDNEKADLKKAGYNNLKELVEDGPEKISEKLGINPEEVLDIAKAVGAVMNNKS